MIKIDRSYYLKPDKILLGHGSGGILMHNLIQDLFLKYLKSPILRELPDAATLKLNKTKLAFTTDSYVVKPLFFPGGDIGKLAIFGTINDLVMVGAIPRYIACGMIIEEGFTYQTLEKVIRSLAYASYKTKIEIVTGDVKVVEKGSCDGIFINTSGIGEILENIKLSMNKIRAGDRVIVTGSLGEHGIAVLSVRGELDFDFGIKSDCASLASLLLPILSQYKGIKFMRDPTRGGLATTLNEIIQVTGLGIILEESNIPISAKVKTACELLGLDPLYIANEGKAVLVVSENQAKAVCNKLNRQILGIKARIIGEVVRQPNRVCLNTIVGGMRVIDMLTSDPLPRIC